LRSEAEETVACFTEPVIDISVSRVSDDIFDGLGIDARKDGAEGANIGGGGW
jgi:hypothetical protein